MGEHHKRPTAELVVALLGAISGCAQYPDIAGQSPEAQEWAKAQQRAEAQQRRSPLYQQITNRRTGVRGWFVSYDDGKTWEPGFPPAIRAASAPVLTEADQGVRPRPTREQRSAAPEHAPAARASQSAVSAAPPNPPPRVSISGLGTCFAIDGRGTLVTAFHVIKGASAVAVRLTSGDLVMAQVVAESETTDVAILKIDRTTSEFLPLGAPNSARVGLPVFTIGFPDPGDLGIAPKFTDGAVSALSGMNDAALMQTTVPVQPGNSGGPLVSDRGEVVGFMVSHAADAYFLKTTGALPQNLNFASKSENLRPILHDKPATRRPTRSRQEAIERTMKSVCLVATLKE